MADQCQVTDCATPTQGLKSWQRYASAQERQALIDAGERIAPDDVVRLMVLACSNHALTPDLRTGTHQSTCAAPPSCTCTPDYPNDPLAE